MTHEVYLSTRILNLYTNRRYKRAVEEIKAHIGINVGYTDKHMTIAFCNEMPMEKYEEVVKTICVDMPHVPLEFTRLRIIGKNNCLVLAAEQVPQEWLDYAIGIKKRLVEEFGCKVDRVDSFLPHITLKKDINNFNIIPVLDEISSRMKPICVRKENPTWHVRTDNKQL